MTEVSELTQEKSETAKAGAAARRAVAEDDLLNLIWVADPQISPDGSRVAFTRVHVDREADDYRTAIWIADAPGGDARAFTFGHKDGQPRWSPDGKSLAFVRTKEGETEGQLWVMPMEGGEPRVLTTMMKGVSAPAWSPDGTRLAFLSGFNPALDDPKKEKPRNEPARVVTRPMFRENNVGFTDFDHRDHVWVLELAGGAPRQLTNGRFAEGAPRWSTDGKRLYFTSDRRAEPWFGGDESVLYAVASDRATPTETELEVVCEPKGGPVAWAVGPRGEVALASSVTPAQDHSFDAVRLLFAAGPGTPPRNITPDAEYNLAETVSSDQHAPRGGGEVPLAFGENGKAVLARICWKGASYLARFDVATGAMKTLTPPASDVISGTASRDGRQWALVIGNPQTPNDLYHLDASTGALTRLFAPNDEFLNGLTLVPVEEFWCDAFDGQKLHGWLMKPPGFDPKKKYPMVLEIHGGPHTAYGFAFFHEFQHLASSGYLVLFTNPRGSTSYGEDFANVIQYKYPGDDYLDLMSCVDHVIARGFVDEKKLGVTGGSGGGLLTNWIVTQTHRFAAAITQRCVADWAAMWSSSDFTLFGKHWFRKPPFEDPAEYAERSPASFASRIETPLMVIHSEEDWRTPIHEGEVMFRSLQRQRKPTVMIRFPGENHELSRSGKPSRRVQNQHHIRSWFDKYLLGKPVTEYDA